VVTVEVVAVAGLAGAYALVNGFNDGASMTGAAIHKSGLRPLRAVATIVLALVLVPLVFGAPVAETLSSGLVGFDGAGARPALVVGVLTAVAVTGALSWLGLPTSLTLATVGAFIGAGLGSGLAVDGREVLRVIALAGAAPLVGGALAFGLLELARLSVASHLGRVGGRVRAVTSVLVALAYAANDGQKMVAVAAVASTSGAVSATRPGVAVLGALAVPFGAGTVLGLRRSGATIGHGVVASRATHLAASEASAAGAVAVTGWLGAPVSMIQSLAGSLAGSGVTDGARRVRWRIAAGLATAWVVTLPAALLSALVVGGLVASATGGAA
jgi:inorganic phosphate transporter, PiT family